MNLVANPNAPDLAQVAAQNLFPPDVTVRATYPWEEADDLLPEEAASLPGAIDKRLREFAAGRRAAQRAMADLCQPPKPVPAGQDRAPQWPRGVTGSISHTDHICLAALSTSPQYLSIGIDIEDDADLPTDLIPEICNLSEMAWLSVQPAKLRGRLARLIFSAKECAYKCQYPISKTLVGFDAFEVTPDLETRQFEATFTQSLPGFPARHYLSGRFAFGAGLIATGMTYARNAMHT